MLGAVCRVEQFAAQTTLEAHLVPFESSGDAFFRGVYGFAAFGTLGVFYWLKRHFVCTPDVGFEVTKLKIGKLGEEDRRER